MRDINTFPCAQWKLLYQLRDSFLMKWGLKTLEEDYQLAQQQLAKRRGEQHG